MEARMEWNNDWHFHHGETRQSMWYACDVLVGGLFGNATTWYYLVRGLGLSGSV